MGGGLVGWWEERWGKRDENRGKGSGKEAKGYLSGTWAAERQEWKIGTGVNKHGNKNRNSPGPQRSQKPIKGQKGWTGN